MAEPALTRSLGPTAFLFVFNPTSPAARPRNEILGHAIGIACGYGALVVTGLQNAPPPSSRQYMIPGSPAPRFRCL